MLSICERRVAVRVKGKVYKTVPALVSYLETAALTKRREIQDVKIFFGRDKVG